LGSPIFDAEDKPIASVWITAPAARLSERDGKRLAPRVIKTGQTISEALR
jgi:DNA-binding IclR family transcriptional regulator